MEITVQILNLSIVPSHEAPVNLHCTVQTASDKFVKSSLLNLDKSSKPIDGETLPVFKYTFRRPYLESAVTFLLSCLKDGNTHQEDLGVAFTPLELESKPIVRDAILKLQMKDAPLYVNTGRVRYRVSYSLTQGKEVVKPSHKQWVGLSSARLNLPLLNDPECGWMGSKSEVEETGDFLKMREAEQKHLNGVLMPGKDPTLTVIFHSFATSWNIDKFTPFMCLIKEEVSSTNPNPQGPAIPGPSAQWFWNETHKTGSLTACDVLKVIDFKIKSPSFQSASLYLFEENIYGPILHITEPIHSLAPFRYYHRGWLPNIPQPTIPSDSCVHDSIHVLTSIHMLPTEHDYESYQGFEVIVTDVSYEDLSEDTSMVFGVELIRKSQSEILAASHSQGFVPPFFEKRGSDHTHSGGHGGGDNFKVSFYTPPDLASSDDQICKAYFFFPENEEVLTRDIRNENTPTFIFHACIIDKPGSSLPWWIASHHYQAPLEIDSASFNLLASHKGVKWFHSWEGVENSSSCSLEVALRWKNASCRFLSPNDSQEMAEQQYLQVLLHHFSLKNQQQAAYNLVDSAVADIMRQNPAAAPLSMMALNNLTETLQQQLRKPDTTSELSLDERTYRQTIQELGAVVLKVQQEKEVLERDNARLSDELAMIKAKQKEIVQSDTLEHALPYSVLVNKVALLEKELDDRKAEVDSYREKAQILQNELEKKNYQLETTRISNHEQVKNLHRKVNKYQRCYKMAVQQDRILTELENLIAQLPAKEQNGNNQNQNNADNTGNRGVDRTGRQSSTSNDSNIGDDEISPEPHLQQAVNAMGNEISRLRQENDLLRSHLSSIIKAMDINTRKQHKSHHPLSPLIDCRNEEDRSRNNREPPESKTNEQLTSF